MCAYYPYLVKRIYSTGSGKELLLNIKGDNRSIVSVERIGFAVKEN